VIRSKLPLAFTGLLLFSFLSWNCTKIDSTTLGGGLIPAVDNVNTFETILNVVANNIDSTVFPGKECAIIYPTDDHVLGYISNDPLFGTTRATLYTELKPAVFPFSFQGELGKRTLDSVVLVLSYKRTYGDTTADQRVEVHEITNDFNPDSSTCRIYQYNIPVLGSKSFKPRELNDSVKLPAPSRDTTINQLRIRLNYGQSLLALDTIKTDSAFKHHLKGFAIVPDLMGNALNYFSIADTRTKLAVYYTYKRTGLSDTSVVTNFSLYNGDKSANHIVRTRGTSEISTVANTANPNGDNFIYIQTTPGSFAELKIPGLTGMSNRIIHRAELIMEQSFSAAALDNIFTPPNFLFLNVKDSLNSPIPCDFTVISNQPDIATFGGYNNPFTNAAGTSIARYTFNISRYVQKTITKQRPMATLKLSAPNYVRIIKNSLDECNISLPGGFLFPLNGVAEGRVKLVGGNINSTAPNRIRLRIVYSNL
jgi:hypothetical protein